MKKIKKLAENMVALAQLSNDPYHKGVANGVQAALNLFYNKPNDAVPFNPAEGIHLFPMRVERMNINYDLPCNYVPTLPDNILARLLQFKEILTDEINEIDDIINTSVDTEAIDKLVMIADLLADITVYCRSEAYRCGIPLEEVLQIVMDSNETKLGADGMPIKDGNDKFIKGPDFAPPEPAIKELLLEKINDNN